MKKIVVFILLAGMLCGLCACEKSETAAVPAVPSTAQTVSETVQQKENKLGVVFCGMNIDATSDILNDVCAQAGLNINDYSDVLSLFCNAQDEAMTCAMNCVDAACTDILLVMYTDEYMTVFEDIKSLLELENTGVYAVIVESVNTSVLVGEYAFTPISTYHSGLLWVTFTDGSGAEKHGIINEDGILLYVARDGASVYDFGTDNYTYYTSEECDVVVDKYGKEHLVTNKAEEEKVSICGHGDNVFVLRKEVKTFSQNAIYISMVDADGNVIFADQEIEKDLDTNFTYYGEGVFRSYKSYNGALRIDGCFVNAVTGAIFREYNYDDELITPFINHQAYFKASGFNGMFGMSTLVTPEVFESEASYLAWHESLTAADEMQIYKPELDYSQDVKVLNYGSFENGLAPVLLLGVDGREYFTVINEQGDQMYEPFKLPERKSIIEYNLYTTGAERNSTWRYVTDLFYSQGRLIYLEDDVVYLVDTTGKKNSINIGFDAINFFDGKYVYLRKGIYNTESKETMSKISLYSQYMDLDNTLPQSVEEPKVTKTYLNLSSFSIEGKWKSVGSYGFGQAQSGAIVVFDGTNCNFFSPKDTYAFSKDGDNYKLECTSFMSTDTLTFTVKTVDEDNIDIYYSDNVTELTRVN